MDEETNALVRSLDIILLGLEADVHEALSSYRTERSMRDVKEGLKSARKSLDQLIAKGEANGHAQDRLNGHSG